MPYNQYFFIVLIIIFGVFIFMQSKKMRKQQDIQRSFQENLKPGTLVITISGVIGKVVSVDTKYEEIVIDSEGTLLRVVFKAISREYVRPAFIDDDENAKEEESDDCDNEQNENNIELNNDKLSLTNNQSDDSSYINEHNNEPESNHTISDEKLTMSTAVPDDKLESEKNEKEQVDQTAVEQPEYGQYAS